LDASSILLAMKVRPFACEREMTIHEGFEQFFASSYVKWSICVVFQFLTFFPQLLYLILLRH